MLTKEELPECPVATTVQLIGSKWKLLIIRNLRMRPWRFNELQKNLAGISQKVLTDSLRALESDGFATRTVYAEVTPRSVRVNALLARAHPTQGKTVWKQWRIQGLFTMRILTKNGQKLPYGADRTIPAGWQG